MVTRCGRMFRKTGNRGIRFIRRNLRVVREDTSTFLGTYNIFYDHDYFLALPLDVWVDGSYLRLEDGEPE